MRTWDQDVLDKLNAIAQAKPCPDCGGDPDLEHVVSHNNHVYACACFCHGDYR